MNWAEKGNGLCGVLSGIKYVKDADTWLGKQLLISWIVLSMLSGPIFLSIKTI
jgi:hypothetical protein